MISALRKAANKHNALAVKPKERAMGSVSVVILRDGTYNDEHGKATPRKVGDTHDTEHGYAEIIVASGSASFDVAPDVVVPPVEEGPVEPAETLFTDVRGVSKAVNAALLAAGATWEKIREMPVSSLTKVPGLGPKTAALLKAQAEVEHDKARTQ